MPEIESNITFLSGISLSYGSFGHRMNKRMEYECQIYIVIDARC